MSDSIPNCNANFIAHADAKDFLTVMYSNNDPVCGKANSLQMSFEMVELCCKLYQFPGCFLTSNHIAYSDANADAEGFFAVNCFPVSDHILSCNADAGSQSNLQQDYHYLKECLADC